MNITFSSIQELKLQRNIKQMRTYNYTYQDNEQEQAIINNGLLKPCMCII